MVMEERSERVFQIGGIVAWAMVGVDTFLQFAHSIDSELLPKVIAVLPPADAPRGAAISLAIVWAVALLLFIGFALAFRATTRAVAQRVNRRHVLLLALQVLLALAVSTDLLYLVAAEIPFVLTGRWALAWFGVQSLVTATLAFTTEPIELLASAATQPRPLAVGLTVLSVLAWQGLAFAAGSIAASQARRRRELARLNAELLATQQVLSQSVRVAERTRIARDLHDTLGHHLAALSVNLELAGRLVDGRAEQPIAAAKDTARLLLAEVRSVISETRDAPEVELKQALEILASGIEAPRVHLAMPAGAIALAPPAAHALFRAAQEAITNAVRHAGAANLWIDVGVGGDGVSLVARDDGRGAAALVAGNGLRGMRERLEALGGRLALDSRPGEGLTLTAWVPSNGGTP